MVINAMEKRVMCLARGVLVREGHSEEVAFELRLG